MSEVAVPLGVGADAMLESGMLAEHLLEDGDCQGAAMWQRIRDAIAWLQAKAPAEGGRTLNRTRLSAFVDAKQPSRR